MPSYELTARLLTPCCLSERPAMGNEIETLDYIPGTALRGMLAAEYLREHPSDPLFRKLFCSDEIRFPNLYPVNHYPLPLSAHTCKRGPGFASDSSPADASHGVWDLLFEDCPQFEPSGMDRRHQIDSCGGPLKMHGERWYWGENEPRRAKNSPSQLLSMRTAVAHAGSALKASLHSQHELAAGSRFSGILSASGALTDKGEELSQVLLRKLGMQDKKILELVAYTGRRRAGQVSIRIASSTRNEPSGPLFLNPWPKPAEADSCYFAMTFTSDVILIDDVLRPIASFDRGGAVLKRYCGEGLLDGEDREFLTVEKAFVATRTVSGWNAVAQIFKPDDLAMVKGSTFLVKIRDRDSDKEAVEVWMKHLIARGLGLRRAEGFGQVRFDDPFHVAAARCKGGPL